MKTGLNDLEKRNLDKCITGKYELFCMFPENFRGFPFIYYEDTGFRITQIVQFLKLTLLMLS